MNKFLNQLHSLIDLRFDTNYEKTDESIRQNVNFKSANAWTLVFAIFIASVGLNMNSTAVIIGAMLISPLMGPIVGAGYSLGINDFVLLKASGRNLLYAVGISLTTSTIYFLVSPFTEVQNEILARTSPNFYDVVIAIFGGAAGIVAMSRSEKSNAIPGVAIATALMPPLCTAGFGLATLNWKFLLGALYLFVINSVFICLSTYIFVRYLKFKKVSYANVEEQKNIHRWVIGIAFTVAVPSLVTAWLLLSQTTFRHKANQFVENEVRFKTAYLADKKFVYDFKNSVIKLTFIGVKLKASEEIELKRQMKQYGLQDTKLEINQVALDDHTDEGLNNLKKDELPFKKRLAEVELELSAIKEEKSFEVNLVKEIQIFLPSVNQLFIEGEIAQMIWKKNPTASEKQSAEKLLNLRLNRELKTTHAKAL